MGRLRGSQGTRKSTKGNHGPGKSLSMMMKGNQWIWAEKQDPIPLVEVVGHHLHTDLPGWT